MVVGVDRMQAAAHVVDVCTEVLECVGLDIDVAEFYGAGASGADATVALPVNAGVTDWAFGVVPNDEGWQRFQSSHRLTEEKRIPFSTVYRRGANARSLISRCLRQVSR
jgi:hypothetical protein